MAGHPEPWATVRARLASTRFADVRVLDEVDSTNRVLLDEARAGAPDGVVLVAEHQRAGRGRLGRSWSAPRGGSLLVSVLLRRGLSRETMHLPATAAGLALADAVREVAGLDAELKWPNDLLVSGRKLAGVLAEADVGADGSPRAVVVGVGLNVNWDAVPAELAGIATACNLETGRTVDRGELLVAFLTGLDARLARPERVAHDYRRRLATLGRRVRVERHDGDVVGRAVDVDGTGRLLVEVDAGCIVEIAAGDVVHLRAADPA
jgi:BirA family biotin operon repressor/biotin-[acetyl-CoA-carboxylase] ligase